MNINDSDSARALEPQPGNIIAVPRTAERKSATLKARLAKILTASGVKTAQPEDGPAHFTFGAEKLDKVLRGNAAEDGLPRAALHEIHSSEKEDSASAAAMALLLAERVRSLDAMPKPILWICESGEERRQGKLYPPGLAELGLDPAQIIHVDAPDSIAVLRAAADSVRSSAMGAVIVELAGKKPKGLDMTATRRLSLAAQQSGVATLLLRSGIAQDDPLPSTAFSRWGVSAASSSFLSINMDAVPALSPFDKKSPGHPAFDLTLLRHRSGLYGLSARLEWNRDDRMFEEISRGQQREAGASDIGASPPLPAVRADHKDTRAA